VTGEDPGSYFVNDPFKLYTSNEHVFDCIKCHLPVKHFVYPKNSSDVEGFILRPNTTIFKVGYGSEHDGLALFVSLCDACLPVEITRQKEKDAAFIWDYMHPKSGDLPFMYKHYVQTVDSVVIKTGHPPEDD